METLCGKSMLGSLCLSILLIACLSFDVGSTNSSEEEMKQCASDVNCPSSAPFCHEHLCRVCWDDALEGREGCDLAHEYCDMDRDRCVPFTDYTYRSGYGCHAPAVHSIENFSTLRESVNFCNAHSSCNCVEFRHIDLEYSTYTVDKQSGKLNCDSWLKL